MREGLAVEEEHKLLRGARLEDLGLERAAAGGALPVDVAHAVAGAVVADAGQAQRVFDDAPSARSSPPGRAARRAAAPAARCADRPARSAGRAARSSAVWKPKMSPEESMTGPKSIGAAVLGGEPVAAADALVPAQAEQVDERAAVRPAGTWPARCARRGQSSGNSSSALSQASGSGLALTISIHTSICSPQNRRSASNWRA